MVVDGDGGQRHVRDVGRRRLRRRLRIFCCCFYDMLLHVFYGVCVLYLAVKVYVDTENRNRERASGYTLIANNAYPDGSKVDIETGCQGIR